MTSSAPPPLNALRTFEAFARHRSMTDAASELCVTHGAVSRQVATLQAHLGVELVSGPRHLLTLTPVGAGLAAGLSGAFSTITDAVAVARADVRREIEISCLGTFALKWLIPRLPGFVAAHPDIRVRVSESYAAVDFARVLVDGAIRILNNGRLPARQEVTAFLPQHQGPVGAPGVTPPGMTMEALARLPRLHAATFRESWAVWADLVGVNLAPPPVGQELLHHRFMIEAAVAGMGVAMVPWAFVAPDIANGRLVAPFGFAQEPSRFVFLRPEGRPDAAVDAFRDWLVAEGSASPPPIPSTGPGAGTRRSRRSGGRSSTGPG